MGWLALLLAGALLCGCSGMDGLMEEALHFRSELLGAESCSFVSNITADYGDTVDRFSLSCQMGSDGVLHFAVESPESIRGITGAVDNDEGAFTFAEDVLAFPLMADDRLSPVSAPWIFVNTLKNGYITAVTREGELLHLSISDSYEDDPLELEIWISREGSPTSAEISWQGRRMLSMEIGNWKFE